MNDGACVFLLLLLSLLATWAASGANSAYRAFTVTSLFPGPSRFGAKVLGATLLDWFRDYFVEMENGGKVSLCGIFFQSKRILVSVNLVLNLGNPVLLRSVLIAVHEEQSCVLTLSALVQLA